MAGRRALKAVLIDLSGTLHIEDTAVPGAQDAMKRYGTAQNGGCRVILKFIVDSYKF